MYPLEPDTHHTLGVSLNNLVWPLLTKPDRTAIDDRKMLAFAEGALHHWHQSPHFKPINAARGHYMVSRVLSELGRGQEALDHATSCGELVAAAGVGDFDEAYALEARARAHAALGELDTARELRERAAAVPIAEEGDRAQVNSDLERGPWFGLDG